MERSCRAVVLALAVLAPSHARAEAAPARSSALARAEALIAEGRYAAAEEAAREALREAEAAHGKDSLAAGDALGALASALRQAGRASEPDTLEAARRALTLTERVLGAEHELVATRLSTLGLCLLAAGELDEARSALDRSLQLSERVLGPDHADTAAAAGNLALALHEQGDLVGARAVYERALAIRERTLDPMDRAVALGLANLGSVLRELGDLAAARARYERALTISEAALGPDHPQVASVVGNLALVLQDAGELAASKPLHERALSIREKALGRDHPRVAVSLDNLASLLHDMGDLAGARRHYERALAIDERTLGSDHPDLAIGLGNLASLLGDLGDHAGARPLQERALAIREKALGPEHRGLATSLNNLAATLVELGDHAGARSLFERTLAIKRAVLGPDHADVATVLDNIAILARRSGDLGAARSSSEQALATWERALGGDNVQVATSLRNHAALLHALGERAAARAAVERALAIQDRVLGELHPDTAATRASLAAALAEAGARSAALEMALHAERSGRDHARTVLRALSTREALLHAAVRASGLGVALSVAASGMDGPSAARAWDAAIRSRAVVLDEVGLRHREGGVASEPVERWRRASRDLANATIRGAGEMSPEAHRKVLEAAAQELEASERALAEHSETFRSRRAWMQAGFDDVARSVHPGEALVAYARYMRVPVAASPEAASASGTPPPPPELSDLAFVLRGGEALPEVVSLGRAADLDALVGAWRALVARPDSDAEALRFAGEALRRAAWDPVATRLGGARRVHVVPDGPLHLVSFAALPAEGGEYVVESGAVLHPISAERDLVRDHEISGKGNGLLALGGPSFDETRLFASLRASRGGPPRAVAPLLAAVATAAPVRGERSRCASLTTMRFEPLPSTAGEARDAARAWRASAGAGESRDALVLSAGRASEAALASTAPGRRVLHLATHGFFLGGRCEPSPEQARGVASATHLPEAPPIENPLLLSGLALAGANHRDAASPEEEDGILTAQEVAALDLAGVEWAVLSACGTGLGDVRTGEGVLGLERAFKVAGVQSVVMSLWSVDDETTRQWMRELYRARLERGEDAATAVREASLHVLRARRARGQDDAPFWWGAFVASGR